MAMLQGLITLVAGTALYCWGLRNEGQGTGIAKLLGFIIMIIALMSVVCIDYYGIRYWQQGYWENPMGMTSAQNTNHHK
jgi:hypothetical protein